MIKWGAWALNRARALPFAEALVVLTLLCATPAIASAQNGTVNGTVTRAANGAGLTGGFVSFCKTPSPCFSAPTNASGGYSISLAPGTYVAYTQFPPAENLVDEIFDDIKCLQFCNPTTATQSGTPIQVVSGGTLTRNFALSAGGSFSGVVTDVVSGAPLAGIGVQVWTGFAGVRNAFVGFVTTTTNSAGAYSIGRLPTGVYFAEYVQKQRAGDLDGGAAWPHKRDLRQHLVRQLQRHQQRDRHRGDDRHSDHRRQLRVGAWWQDHRACSEGRHAGADA